jgi:hypothetical protein
VRLPQFLSLATSKTKKFRETSSIFEIENIKTEAVLQDFLQKWKMESRADGLVPMRFAMLPLHLSKVFIKKSGDSSEYSEESGTLKIFGGDFKTS